VADHKSGAGWADADIPLGADRAAGADRALGPRGALRARGMQWHARLLPTVRTWKNGVLGGRSSNIEGAREALEVLTLAHVTKAGPLRHYR